MKYKEILRQVYEKELMGGNKMKNDLWEEMCENDDWIKVSLKAMDQVKKCDLAIVMPRISHFEDMLGNKHSVNDGKCLIDHRGVLIFYANKYHPGERTKMLLKPIYEA